MSELDSRYDSSHGSTAATGGPLPGQPLSEQPTEVVPPVGRDRPEDTVALPPVPPADDDRSDDPLDDIADWEPDGGATRPDYQDVPVVVRRADPLAGLLLLLSGIAAGVSLLVVWFHGGGTGLDLLRDGVHDLAAPGRLVDRDTWQPLTVVCGGAVLFLLGLLMYVPAKTHRFLGVLALLVSLVVAAGVLVPLADANWDLKTWTVGAWCAVVVGGLGFLGALKALSTNPRTRR